MKTVSAAFVARCAGPHRVIGQVDVYEADGLTLVVEAVGCVNGTVTLDRHASVYGRFSGTFVNLDQTLVARMVKDRCVLRVVRGIELQAAVPELPVYLTVGGEYVTVSGDRVTVGTPTAAIAGTTETFGLGRFTITEVTQDLRTLEVDIVAMDASYLVAERRLPVEYEATAGTPVGDHIHAILSGALRVDALTNFPTTPNQAATVVIGIDQDPWRACQDMARAVAYDLRVDADGMFVMVPSPVLSSATATWTIDSDIQSGTVGWSWVAEAESVTVIGSNPESATIYEGTDVEDDASSVGAGSLRTLVIRDENIGSDQQAADAAAAVRRQQRGSTRTVELSGWWPWAEPTDVVRIRSGVAPVPGYDPYGETGQFATDANANNISDGWGFGTLGTPTNIVYARNFADGEWSQRWTADYNTNHYVALGSYDQTRVIRPGVEYVFTGQYRSNIDVRFEVLGENSTFTVSDSEIVVMGATPTEWRTVELRWTPPAGVEYTWLSVRPVVAATTAGVFVEVRRFRLIRVSDQIALDLWAASQRPVIDELRVLDRVTVPLLGPIQVSTARDPLVEALKPATAPAKVTVDWIEGVVTSTSPLRVDGRRAATVASYTPTLNDKVQVHRSGGRRMIIGKVA